jgi:hypothetical protein
MLATRSTINFPFFSLKKQMEKTIRAEKALVKLTIVIGIAFAFFSP